MSKRIVPVILPGGRGAPFWPLSDRDCPKHLLALNGAHSLLQEAVLRVCDPGLFSEPVIVAEADHADEIEAQLNAIGVAPAFLVIEPEPRGSAAAAALAALISGPNDALLVLPSNQVMQRPDAFRAAIERALPSAQDGMLVTFGVEENGPADRGRTAGAVLFTADAFLDALEQRAPEILAAARASIVAQRAEGARIWPDARGYGRAPPLSIEDAVLEASDQVVAMPVATGWSDIDSWDDLHAIGDMNGAGNVLTGDVVAVDSSDCLIRSDGPTVVTIGAQDLIVVATERGVLVAPRGESRRVEKALAALRRRGDG